MRYIARFVQKSLAKYSTSLVMGSVHAMLWVLLITLVVRPFFPRLFPSVLLLLGPIVVFLFTMRLIQWRMFAPLTGEPFSSAMQLMYSRESWGRCLQIVFAVDLALVLNYHSIQCILHRFYARSLQRAYFAEGKDKLWRNIVRNPFCPFLVFTGTINDYRRPGEDNSIHEISLSSLHTGSETTGYVKSPASQSLAKCTALTSAATDAFILGMLDSVKYRFWLEALNLSMGDYIPFRRRKRPSVRACAQWLQLSDSLATSLLQGVERGPSLVLWWFIYGILFAAADEHVDLNHCSTIYNLYMGAFSIWISMIVLSFFGFLHYVKFLLHSPGIRHLHQASRYYHHAPRPPNLIYVTDGGVQDCTGILQLIRRRCERILLVLASSDADDDLGVLRATIEMAAAEKLGSFYDPGDPRSDVRVALEAYRSDKARPYLHLGIRYGWECGSSAQLGRLIIVKNRLPPDLQSEQIQELLTEEDILQGRSGGSDSCAELMQAHLAGCCCDCCHSHRCNFGPKFPHISNANQCLTPQLFNGLCRLGYAISGEAIELVTEQAGHS